MNKKSFVVGLLVAAAGGLASFSENANAQIHLLACDSPQLTHRFHDEWQNYMDAFDSFFYTHDDVAEDGTVARVLSPSLAAKFAAQRDILNRIYENSANAARILSMLGMHAVDRATLLSNQHNAEDWRVFTEYYADEQERRVRRGLTVEGFHCGGEIGPQTDGVDDARLVGDHCELTGAAGSRVIPSSTRLLFSGWGQESSLASMIQEFPMLGLPSDIRLEVGMVAVQSTSLIDVSGTFDRIERPHVARLISITDLRERRSSTPAIRQVMYIDGMRSDINLVQYVDMRASQERARGMCR